MELNGQKITNWYVYTQFSIAYWGMEVLWYYYVKYWKQDFCIKLEKLLIHLLHIIIITINNKIHVRFITHWNKNIFFRLIYEVILKCSFRKCMNTSIISYCYSSYYELKY